jgi:hypothetical protein
MNRFRQITSNENGVVLISTLLILSLLTIIGISATSTSTVEQQIASNDKNYNVALFQTDAGSIAVTKIVNQVMFDRDIDTTGAITFYPDAATVYNQIKYASVYDLGTTDMEYTLGGTTVEMDVFPWATEHETGGSSPEFITGNQSTAAGGGGGGVKFFRIMAAGQSTVGVSPEISVVYKRPGLNNAGGY